MVRPASERYFYEFQPTDNVLKLGDEALSRLGAELQIDVPDCAEGSAIFNELAAALGKIVAQPIATRGGILSIVKATKIVRASGVDSKLARAWQTDTRSPAQTNFVLPGGSARLQTRLASAVVGQATADHEGRVLIAATDSILNTPADKKDARVQDYCRRLGRHPTESAYATRYIVPYLATHNIEAIVSTHTVQERTDLAWSFAEKHPQLFSDGSTVTAVEAATQGIAWAGNLRQAARAVNPAFDSPDNPQLFVLSPPPLPFARRCENLDTESHLDPYTALFGLIASARAIAQNQLCEGGTSLHPLN